MPTGYTRRQLKTVNLVPYFATRDDSMTTRYTLADLMRDTPVSCLYATDEGWHKSLLRPVTIPSTKREV